VLRLEEGVSSRWQVTSVGHFKMAACSSRKQCLPMAVPWWGRFLMGGELKANPPLPLDTFSTTAQPLGDIAFDLNRPPS